MSLRLRHPNTSVSWKNVKIDMPFADIVNDFGHIRKVAAGYRRYRNYIIIGNGGSITPFIAYYHALRHKTGKKNVFVLSTMDPDAVYSARKKYSKKDTLAIVISKSGNTAGVLENYAAFNGYSKLAITEGGVLGRIADCEIIRHPNIGGRFSGTSIVAYLPLAILGADIESIHNGAAAAYKKLRKNRNIAVEISLLLNQLESKGYTEIFMPVYSSRLYGFIPVIVQLVHETFGKGGKGLSIYGSAAPESQHHTNQRFFGGRRNAIGVFVTVKRHEHDIALQSDVNYLDGLRLSMALETEFKGTFRNAADENIPAMHLELDKADEANLGEFMAFWQCAAVYSAVLRNVNPFDQPDVEKSKRISLDLLKK